MKRCVAIFQVSESGDCACCGHTALIEMPAFNGFAHYACSRCGFETFRPSNVCADITSLTYEDDVDYIDELSLTANHAELLQWNHRHALKYVDATARELRCLDIGCFNGFFVKALIERGHDAFGLDFNGDAIQFGRDRYALSDRISTSSIVDVVSRGEQYDLVTCFEVVEHVTDPRALVESAVKLLKPGGLFVLSTPNSRMCWRPRLDFPPHHVSRFTQASIRALLTNAGLAVTDHIEQMSIFDLTRHFIGSAFRARQRPTLRGGEFRLRPFTRYARKVLNISRPILTEIAKPLDLLLHRLGVRYIGQLVISNRSDGKH